MWVKEAGAGAGMFYAVQAGLRRKRTKCISTLFKPSFLVSISIFVMFLSIFLPGR